VLQRRPIQGTTLQNDNEAVPIKPSILNRELLRSTHIFENAVVRRPSTARAGWIGFHGTTTAHSNQIETEGLKAFKLLTREEIALLCQVGRELAERGVVPAEVNRLCEDAVGFAQSRVVNFFSVSALALEHTITRGGQTKERVLKPLVVEILNNRQFGRCDPRRAEVEGISAKLNAEPGGDPVVYAVYLKGATRMWRPVVHEAVQADGPVERWRIVAKVEAGPFANYDACRKRSATLESARLANQLGSEHFTAGLLAEPPAVAEL
jgi:hypothetical protein